MESFNIFSRKTGFGKSANSATKRPRSGKYPFKAENFKSFADNAAHVDESSFPSSYFEVICIIKGSGTIQVGSQSYEIEDNMMCHFFPGQSYRLVPGEPVNGYRICFSQELLYMTGAETSILFWEGCRSSGSPFYPLKIQADIQPEIEELMEAMVKEYVNNFEFKSQIIKGLLGIFIVYFIRLSSENKPPDLPDTETDIFKRFADLIKENFTSKKTVADYARDLHVTQNYLNEIVKRVSGYTASYHIQQYMLHEAKRLAIYPGLSMKQIAYQLGFLDIAHFSKFFKNKSGMNFTDFKKEIM